MKLEESIKKKRPFQRAANGKWYCFNLSYMPPRATVGLPTTTSHSKCPPFGKEDIFVGGDNLRTSLPKHKVIYDHMHCIASPAKPKHQETKLLRKPRTIEQSLSSMSNRILMLGSHLVALVA